MVGVRDMTECIDVDMLAEVARGTAYVAAVAVDGPRSVVRLAFPLGRTVDVVVPAAPARDGLDLQRPLAVQVHRVGHGGGIEVTCSVIDSAETGPRRIGISLAQALALAEAGVHTVFRTD
jgi:hypothetical protein